MGGRSERDTRLQQVEERMKNDRIETVVAVSRS